MVIYPGVRAAQFLFITFLMRTSYISSYVHIRTSCIRHKYILGLHIFFHKYISNPLNITFVFDMVALTYVKTNMMIKSFSARNTNLGDKWIITYLIILWDAFFLSHDLDSLILEQLLFLSIMQIVWFWNKGPYLLNSIVTLGYGT